MSRLIEDLSPLFQPVARAILAESNAIITPSVIKPISTWRSIQEQSDAVSDGATDLNIGYHNYGLAMDVGVFTPGGVYIRDGRDWRYKVFGLTAKRLGCVWGGEWQDKDWAHIELSGGIRVSQYIAWLNAHSLR